MTVKRSYNQKTLGDALKAVRLQADMTQEKLSELSGVSVRTVRELECGNLDPRASTVEKLYSALGVPSIVVQCMATNEKNMTAIAKLIQWGKAN